MDILAFFTFRTILVLFSTAASVLIVMLMVGIITVEDVVAILNLDQDSANALKRIVERIREVFGNILNILSQLMTKLFGWAGVEVDLSEIKVDVNKDPATDSGN